jgi:hypothetical protein
MKTMSHQTDNDKMLKVNIITTMHGTDIRKTKKQRHGNDDNDTHISNDGGEAPNDDYHELQPQILILQLVIFPHLKSLWYC